MENNQESIEKVVSIFSHASLKKRPEQPSDDEDATPTNFADIMRQNAEKKRKLEEERKKANKSVIRSYRLKK